VVCVIERWRVGGPSWGILSWEMEPIRAGMGMYERIPEGVRAYEVACEA
jgi:hypothetical protein